MLPPLLDQRELTRNPMVPFANWPTPSWPTPAEFCREVDAAATASAFSGAVPLLAAAIVVDDGVTTVYR